MCEGAVLFHAHVHKTEREAAALADKRDEAERLRDERRKQQVRAVWSAVECMCGALPLHNQSPVVHAGGGG